MERNCTGHFSKLDIARKEQEIADLKAVIDVSPIDKRRKLFFKLEKLRKEKTAIHKAIQTFQKNNKIVSIAPNIKLPIAK